MITKMITSEQFKLFNDLFDFYNKELFGGKLNDCMIVTSRKRGANGYFAPQIWNKKSNKKLSKENPDIHEISLNPDHLDRADIEWQSTLVHEMVHLWQRDYGKTSRANYHNKQWAQKMEEIGLMPSNTGKPGGKKTGQRITHYVLPSGLFINTFNRIKDKNIKYISSAMLGERKKIFNGANKTKYECPCGNKVWGKPEMIIICGTCNKRYEGA